MRVVAAVPVQALGGAKSRLAAVLATQTIMGDADDRRRLAAEVLAFARQVRDGRGRDGS